MHARTPVTRLPGRAQNRPMADPAINLDELTPEQQLQLLEDIWDRLSEQPANLPLSDELRAELDRRLDTLEADIQSGKPLGRPWSEVRDRLGSR